MHAAPTNWAYPGCSLVRNAPAADSLEELTAAFTDWSWCTWEARTPYHQIIQDWTDGAAL